MLLQYNKVNKQWVRAWKYPRTPQAADVYTDQAGLRDTVAWCHPGPSIFPHSRWVRLMPHMCSPRTAVLFYSKSYQRIKGRGAQRGVSWHRRAEVRQEGKSQIVGAPHMCSSSDENLRCKAAPRSQSSLPISIGRRAVQGEISCFLRRSVVLLFFFFFWSRVLLCWQALSGQISPWGPTATLQSWKAYAADPGK